MLNDARERTERRKKKQEIARSSALVVAITVAWAAILAIGFS